MQKIGNTSFIFPLGKNGSIRKFGISDPASITDNFRLEFIDNFTGLSIVGDSSAGTIPGCDYWKLNRMTGTSSVKVSLYWDSLSCETQNYSVFKVAKYNNSTWEGDANSVVYGNELNGNVTSSVNYSNTNLFTISGLFCNNLGTITILPEPGTTINYRPGNPVGPLNICVGQSITFTFDQSVINCLTNFSGFGYYGIIPPVGASVVTQVFPSNSSITYPFNLPGTYTIVTKINNVALTASQVLNQPNQSFTINVQQLSPVIFSNNVAVANPLIICNGENELICADQTYAIYLWSTGATTQCISVSGAGNYSLLVTDNIGCTGLTDIDVQVIPCCSLSLNLTVENACLPATTGSIEGDITNGTAPYN
jgi:hypothetical protein